MKFAVLGSPIAHSKSPAMHNAAFRALGMDHSYEKILTESGDLPSRIASLRDGTYAGYNLTIPLKQHVLPLVDVLDASVEATGAANTLLVREGRVVAYNTDGLALVAELERLGAPTRGRSGIVLGSGGAAKAAAFALQRLGMACVTRARSDGTLAAPPRENQDLGAIIQATSAGMTSPGDAVADAIDWTTVPRDAVAIDVVYSPPVTPFLERAATHGIAHANGLGMLVTQGALAFELWTGVKPPLDVMRATVSAP